MSNEETEEMIKNEIEERLRTGDLIFSICSLRICLINFFK